MRREVAAESALSRHPRRRRWERVDGAFGQPGSGHRSLPEFHIGSPRETTRGISVNGDPTPLVRFQPLTYALPSRSMSVSPMCENLHRRVHRMRRRRGGGPATWARWSMARGPLRRLTVSRARKACGSSRSRRLPATTSRAQWGCIGVPNGATDERCRTGWRLGERAAQEPRGTPGDWHPKLKSEPVPGVLLPCSLTVLSCEARRRREMTRATSSGVQGEGGGEIPTP